jgi:hypothetical protein
VIPVGDGTENEEAPRTLVVPPPDLRVPTEADLRRRFFYHLPRDQKAIDNHESVSEYTFRLAVVLTTLCPPGRNLSLALTALEDVRMRANAAIACDDPRP